MNDTNILLETGTNELEILEFHINETTEENTGPTPSYFGINVAKVVQVIESPNLEAPESAPHPSFLGTIPLRDLILPVLDLSVWLNIEKKKSDLDVVIVTEFSQAVTGFLVSGVTEIHRVGWKDVIPPNTYLSKVGTDSIIGLVNMDNHFIQLLDLETILSEFTEITTPEEVVDKDHGYTVLLADDSATIRLMLSRSMEEANFGNIITNNGEDALTSLKKIRQMAEEEGKPITNYVNAIVSDIEMPLMDGFTLTKNIKQDPILSKLPVILYSSIITKELKHKGESVKADAQISKPDIGKIPGIVLDLIEGREIKYDQQ